MSAFDEITWSPRLGTTGDDIYNVRGSTKLDGTVDTGAPTPIVAGDTSGFSATPTIAQINASSHINQVIGYYNRRVLNWNAQAGTALSTMSYAAQGTKPSVITMTTLLSNISTLMTFEGFQSVSLAWPNTTPTSKQPCRGDHLAYLRKVLKISGTIKYSGQSNGSTTARLYDRVDNPYGTHSSEAMRTGATLVGTGNLGKDNATDVGADMHRRRMCLYYNIPSFVTANLASATFAFDGRTNGNNSLETYNMVVYSSNSDDSGFSLGTGYNGAAYNTNNLEISVASSSLTSTMQTFSNSLTPSHVYARAGSRLSLIVGIDTEISGTGLGVNSTSAMFDGYGALNDTGVLPKQSLTLVF